MQKSTFHISKMDCPSEETLIRMKLEGLSMIKSLVFDIENRKLTVFHSEESSEIENHLKELNLGSQLQETIVVQADEFKDNSSVQSKLLWTVLIINFAFFLLLKLPRVLFLNLWVWLPIRWICWQMHLFMVLAFGLSVQLCSVRKKSGKAEWLFSTGFSIDWAYRSNTQIYQFRSCAGFQNHDYCFHIGINCQFRLPLFITKIKK